MDEAALSVIAKKLYAGSKLEHSVPLTGGVSANVYRLDLKTSDGILTSVVLREHGSSHSGHPADLEFELLQALQRTALPVPQPLHVDSSRRDLPNPYLIMSFAEGGSEIFEGNEDQYITAMADLLADIHDTPISGLPELPERCTPFPELYDLLPEQAQAHETVSLLKNLEDAAFRGPRKLLHGDFWPENVLWENDRVSAIVDWEDAAIGDPLSDVACCQLELRYKLGPRSVSEFLRAYKKRHPVEIQRLYLWQLYVASAAQAFMATWGLPVSREAHMRDVAIAATQEAIAALIIQR